MIFFSKINNRYFQSCNVCYRRTLITILIIKFYCFKKIIEKYYVVKLLLQFSWNNQTKFVPLKNINL